MDQFGFIAVDTDVMPYQCTVFHGMTEGSINQGRALYLEDLATYARCVEADEWPGYPDEYDVLDVSGYAFDYDELETE